ncbi:hypothetical protein M0R45_014901 [Rubus argutus]|uniref:RING-type E3 ubiquitin transferase n=1 Tax=Rubus argutus TaxID=59490 RepID=A0AAW1XQG8_RUBAR
MWYTLPQLLTFLFVITSFSFYSVSYSATPDNLSYADHCASIVPESTPKRYAGFDPSVLRHTGFYTGGGSGFHSPKSSDWIPYEPQNSIEFNARSVEETDVQDLFKVQGSLQFQRDSYHVGNVTGRLPQSSIRFALNGFWSESSGKLCMVGSGSIYSEQGDLLNDIPALLKLHNLMNFTSVTSLISGTLESLTSCQKDPNYFEPISILMLPRMNYQYTLVSNKSEDDSYPSASDTPSGSSQMEKFCSVLSGPIPLHEFDLKYSSHCLSAKKCTTPLSASEHLPLAVALRDIECLEDKRRLRVLIQFADRRYICHHMPFNPSTTLVGEGSWDAEKNQLYVVACQFLDAAADSFNNSRVGDCSTRLSLTFPGIWTIGDTRSTAGYIWSNKTVKESGDFENIAFESHEPYVGGVQLAGQKYEYTQMDKVAKLCPREKSTAANDNKTNIYPNPFSFKMRFHMFAMKSKKATWGSASPVSVGSQLYEPKPCSIGDADSIADKHSSPYDISYHIFIYLRNTPVRDLISAEGVYDDTDGSLCMVGCRNLGSKNQQPTNDSVDCEILLNFQLPPKDEESRNSVFVKGSIESIREQSDPLHFERYEFSSGDTQKAEVDQSLRRVEVEITLVLISTTLACVFGALQLFHVKKCPDVLPSISILMLLILTLGYMIPLMYYFEAIYKHNTDLQNAFLGSGGCLQMDQVIVRVITAISLVPFLLQFHLLQKIWSVRSANGTFKELWDVEKKALSVYAMWVLAATALLMNSSQQEHPSLGCSSYGAYAGLILDGFLFPQILLNMVCKSKEKALSASFYMGTTFVRVLPHAYDLYRTGSPSLVWEEPYIFASPEVDFYSNAWDVIILIGGLLFALIIFLQQKFGGRCFLPQKWKELGTYEKVPTVGEA